MLIQKFGDDRQKQDEERKHHEEYKEIRNKGEHYKKISGKKPYYQRQWEKCLTKKKTSINLQRLYTGNSA